MMNNEGHQDKASNVLLLYQLLASICKSPVTFSGHPTLVLALKSQATTAALTIEIDDPASNTKYEVFPTSLNTLKAYANEFIIGGFRSLDLLRKQALDRINQSHQSQFRPEKRTKQGLALKVASLEADLQKTRQDNVRLLQAASEALNYLMLLKDTKDDSLRAKHHTDAVSTIYSIISLNTSRFKDPSASKSNITQIDDYRI